MQILAICPLKSISDTKTAADVEVDIKEKIESAKDWINRGNYQEALGALQDAYSIEPSPMLLFNIAMCEKALGRYVDSVRSFHRYFVLQAERRVGNSSMDELAQKALDELLTLVGSLEIVDAPDGAAIAIDGALMGTTPLTEPLYLGVGSHTVTVTKEGRSPMEIDVIVVGGAALSVRAGLTSMFSKIQVICNDPNSRVFIDGALAGSCPYEADLPFGLHGIRISAPGRKTVSHQVSAEARRTTVLTVDLESIFPKLPPIVRDMPRTDSPNVWVFRSGIATAVVGAVGIGLGGVFTYKRSESVNDADKTNTEIETYKDNNQDNLYSTDLEDLYDKHNDYLKKIRAWEKRSIVGYTIGGSLIAVGAGMITYYLINKKGGKRHEVSFQPLGMEVTF